MDVKIKGKIDGIETAERIQSSYDIPIIYLTAFADDNSIERAKTTAPYGYIIKPFDEKRLQTSIDMALYKHRLEKKLKENQRWLSITLNNIGEALIAADKDGRIKFLNPEAEELTCWTQQEALSQNLSEVFKLTDGIKGEVIKNPLNAVYNKGETIHFNNEYFLINKVNIKIPILGTASPIKNDQDNITGIILIFQDITEIKNREKEREDLFNKVIEGQNRLKVLSRRLIDVQESERGNISRELHDEIGQSLTAVKISLQTLKNNREKGNSSFYLDESIELVEYTINQVRNLSLDLRPSMIDDLGLIPAIRSYVNRQAQRAEINVKFKADQNVQKLSPGLEITSYRIVQEAITNILRHSNAKNIRVELWSLAGKLHIKIIDDGEGFNVQEARMRAVSGGSIGILSMQERVELVGGSFDVHSEKGKGTEIYAILPVE
jgi:PAS domain S-box-containing protein